MGTGKKPTDFEQELIWNNDGTACFLTEEFSNAHIVEDYTYHDDFFVVNISLKNGQRIIFPTGNTHFSTKNEAEALLKKLMSEIGEKQERWKYKQMRPQKG